jgi:hypothetical protein
MNFLKKKLLLTRKKAGCVVWKSFTPIEIQGAGCAKSESDLVARGSNALVRAPQLSRLLELLSRGCVPPTAHIYAFFSVVCISRSETTHLCAG